MSFELKQEYIDDIQERLEQGAVEAVTQELCELHPADIAEVLDELTKDEALMITEEISPELLGEVLVQMDEDLRADILETYTGKEIAEEVVENLDSDDAADIISELDEDKKLEVLSNLEDIEQAKQIADLLTHAEDTAGALMATELVKVNNLSFSRGERIIFDDICLEVPQGKITAIMGPSGIGKTTLLRNLINELPINSGRIQWAENASLGYCPQDPGSEFDNDLNLFDWMSQWKTAKHNDLMVRAMLGRMLFTEDDINKKAKVCSGGEKNRLLFGKLMMMDINVLIMDEPTNHMDMEAIEALNEALKKFDGTLIFVSHDREFVSSLATRVIEIKDQEIIDFQGTYDEYLAHLEGELKKIA